MKRRIFTSRFENLLNVMDKEDTQSANIKRSKKKSLLERYDIPIERISYEYISECTNSKILEHIILILRSGEEGYYPDLTRHAEERLLVIKPNSTILRKIEPVLTRNMLDPSERTKIDNDIVNWTCEMRCREKDLDEGRIILTNESIIQPDVRQFNKNAVQAKPACNLNVNDKSKRISSCDYAAWDKYDVDTEINKIDIKDEQRRTKLKEVQRKQQIRTLKKASTNDTIINKSSLTGTELEFIAQQEKEKGNEAFRAGDYREALEYYNSSIKLDSNLTTYNNRAMTLIKLQQYEDAVNDCNVVLCTEQTNIKALLRRALALEHLEKRTQALSDYETVLALEPTNKSAISKIKKLRKPESKAIVRMAIQEICADENETTISGDSTSCKISSKNNSDLQSDVTTKSNSSICFCDRAPGPSQILKPRPHFKAEYCIENDNQQTDYEIQELSRKTELLTKSINENDSCRGYKNSLLSSKKFYSENFNSISNESSKNPSCMKSKTIFSCVSPCPTKNLSTVIIEEIPAETPENKTIIDKNNKFTNIDTKKSQSNDKIKNNVKLENNKVTNLFSINDQDFTHNLHKVQLTCKNGPPAEKYNIKTYESENIFETVNNITKPYEFIRIWQSIKNDTDFKIYAKLLYSLSDDNLHKGNKLDGPMLSIILHCMERHFCTPETTKKLYNLLESLSQVNRFSIVCMFMDSEDKKALKNIFYFLEKQRIPDISVLRQACWI